MSWNYRIVAVNYYVDKIEYEYSIHEVYYNEDGSIRMWTKYDVGIGGSSVEELKQAYEMYGKAFDKPVLYLHTVDGKDRLIENEATDEETS